MKKKLKYFALLFALSVIWQLFLSSCDRAPDHQWSSCEAEVHSQDITGASDYGGPHSDVALIDFDDSLSHDEVLAYGEEMGLNLQESHTEATVDRNLYLARVAEGSVPRLEAHLLEAYSGVVQGVDEQHYVHTQHYASPFAWEPNDPLYQFQWHLEQVEAVESWTLASGKGAVVAVIDTGIALDTDNERGVRGVRDLLNTSRVEGWDFVEDSSFSYDPKGHGTHVAGTIAQSTHNNYGVAGVAYDATLMNVRVLDDSGTGTLEDVVAGVYFAADNGATVINMSLSSPHPSDLMQEAVTEAHHSGVTVIAAAGNSGKREPGYPAALDNVISVTSTQYDKHPAFYSQWGPHVDLAAPGGNTRVDQNKDGRPDGVLQEALKDSGDPSSHGFVFMMGTSMAAPHVAGVAALINQWGVTHPDRVEHYLKKGALKVHLEPEGDSESSVLDSDDDSKTYSPKEFAERYGAGIVQADSAVTSAILDPALIRLALAILLGSLLFVIARQVNLLDADIRLLGSYLVIAAWAAAGFFFLPFLIPGMEVPTVAFVVQLLATPVMGLDWVLLGMTQTPLASFALPALVLLLLHGHSYLRYVGAGFAVGCASYLLSEMVILTSPLLYIPGGDMAARVYYFLNALPLLVLVYFSLTKGLGEVEVPQDETED